MAKLDIITWLWGDKYKSSDVVRLKTQVGRNLRADHNFHLFADRRLDDLPSSIDQHLIADKDLCDRRCFCRLRMFDPVWQALHGFKNWIVSLDLDLVITGSLDEVFKTNNRFMILKGVNAVNPNPLNGSLMMLSAGSHPEVWEDFSLEKVEQIQFHEFPDDQGWIWHKLPDADGWKGGTQGVYAFQKPGWPHWPALNFDLPPDAKVVAFIGKRKPERYMGLPWVKKYWQNYL